MKNKTFSLIIFILIATPFAFTQEPKDTEDWSRRPRMILPGENHTPPSDAIVLFDGTNFNEWDGKNGSETWKLVEKTMEVVPGNGTLTTKRMFGDVQLHIEWRTPREITGDGQDRSNSGIYLMSLYELQVLDSWDNETYYNGQAGSIYKQHIPLVNACLPPGKWQTYDIIFIAPRFKDDQTLKSPGYFTVFQNGVLIQYNVELKDPTVYTGKPEFHYHEQELPITLQDHGNAVRYRNIWIRELDL